MIPLSMHPSATAVFGYETGYYGKSACTHTSVPFPYARSLIP
jgi:hypothetical protein